MTLGRGARAPRARRPPRVRRRHRSRRETRDALGDVGRVREIRSPAEATAGRPARTARRPARIAPRSRPFPSRPRVGGDPHRRASSAQLTPSEARRSPPRRLRRGCRTQGAAARARRRRRGSRRRRGALKARAASRARPRPRKAPRAPEEPPTRAATKQQAGGSLPPARNSPSPPGPGRRWYSARARGPPPPHGRPAPLVEGAVDAEAAPQVTVTLDGGDSGWNRIGDGQDKTSRTSSGRASPATPASGTPHKALSPLESAPAMPIVRAAKKLPETAPARAETLPGGEPEKVAPARPSWSGWAVKSPPPKVDLKAEMEAELGRARRRPNPPAVTPAETPRRLGAGVARGWRAEATGRLRASRRFSQKKAGKPKTSRGSAPPPPRTDRRATAPA